MTLLNLSVGVEVCDQIRSLLGLLESREHHLGSRDVLLGVQEVREEVLVIPCDPRLAVGLRVGEAGNLSGLAAVQAE